MKVPLLVNDFLDRAETVFADRVGVIDEPDCDDNVGRLTYREVAHRVRAVQAGLDELGIAPGERVAVVSPNAARLLELFYAVPSSGRILVPINFRLRLEEVEYIVEHSGASVLLVDPALNELATVSAKHRFALGAESDAALLRFDREPQPWSDADEDATAFQQAAPLFCSHERSMRFAPTKAARLRSGLSSENGFTPGSQCTELMRSARVLRSKTGSMRPTRRSPWRIGRT